MKLLEIKDPRGPANYKGIPIVPIKHDPKLNRSDRLGDPGTEASAFKSKTKPNTVFKVSKIKDRNNPATLDFVAMVMQNQDNPFMPRIHKAKILRNRYDDYLAVEMEQLMHVTDPKMKDSAQGLIDSLDIPHDSEAIGDKYQMDGTLFQAFDTAGGRAAVRNARQNPQLKQALQAMEPIFQKYGADVHNQNIMVRLTRYGPQLVFSDPIHPDKNAKSEWTNEW